MSYVSQHRFYDIRCDCIECMIRRSRERSEPPIARAVLAGKLASEIDHANLASEFNPEDWRDPFLTFATFEFPGLEECLRRFAVAYDSRNKNWATKKGDNG